MHYHTEGSRPGGTAAAPNLREEAARIRRLVEEAQARYEAGLARLAQLEQRLGGIERRLS